MQLAALAFPADPASLSGIPHPLAVQQQETRAAGRRAITAIEPGNAGCCRFQQRLIAIDVLRWGIEPVRDQREMQFPFRACKVVDLQKPDLLFDRVGCREQRRHRDERAQVRRDAATKFQSRQRRCAEAAHHAAIHHRYRHVDGRHHAEDTEQAAPCRTDALRVQRQQWNGEKDSGNDAASANIAANAELAAQASGPGTR